MIEHDPQIFARLKLPLSSPLITWRSRQMQKPMSAITFEIIVGVGRRGDMKCIKGRTKEKNHPTTHAAPRRVDTGERHRREQSSVYASRVMLPWAKQHQIILLFCVVLHF